MDTSSKCKTNLRLMSVLYLIGDETDAETGLVCGCLGTARPSLARGTGTMVTHGGVLSYVLAHTQVGPHDMFALKRTHSHTHRHTHTHRVIKSLLISVTRRLGVSPAPPVAAFPSLDSGASILLAH